MEISLREVLDAILVGTGGVYLVAMTWLLRGLGRSARESDHSPRSREGNSPVSVIVAARDEAASIGACLSALKSQDYGGRWEVIVVDDRSVDGTGAIVERLRAEGVGEQAGELKLIRTRENPPFACPKKSALAQGIAASSGELLLFTDADCQPPPQWIRSTVSMFGDDVGLVAGYAYPRSGSRLRDRLLALDNAAVGAMGAGSFVMGSPLACTGRNLAYRRQVFDEVGGFADIGHLIGGDDVYFARLVAEKATSWRRVYNTQPQNAVACDPGPAGWRDLTQQKLRHAAKAGHYGGAAAALGAAVYLFHLVLLMGLLRSVLQLHAGGLLAGVWGAKWLLDFALLWRFESGTVRDWRLLAFLPILEVVYIPYVLLFVPLGRLGLFRWKNRGFSASRVHSAPILSSSARGDRGDSSSNFS